MNSRVKVLLMTLLLFGCTAQQIQSISDAIGLEEELTAEQVASGLKEALVKGVTTGTQKVGKVDGYFKNPQIKIPFPPDIQKVENTLRDVGLGNEVDRFVKTLNRGAEEAAKEAKPVFVSAIKQMTIDDAWDILKGTDKEAATNYLMRTTSDELRDKFSPIVKRALGQTNATKYYSEIITRYNKIPMVEDVNPDLESYATEKAMEGLFFMIASEEKKIRANPSARTSDLLKKVFKEQD
ncbi:Protein of unknown function [Ekhidna lutea]|uniref:DUF4197 domain-containing protein n=2 Tax=Ekhidna lutea TaxID=447679 RepID=A0A239HY69_EKHLU|nr:Protein of unknown function [Ekhidna lutea]